MSTEEDKITITFVGDAARAVRAMAETEETTPTELARRALFLMDVYLQLEGKQEFVVYDNKTNKMAFLRFPWKFKFGRQS